MSIAPDLLEELKKQCVLPQKQEGLFVIRLRSLAGNLTCDQLQAIARVAGRYGSSRVHLSARQGMEIHHVPQEQLETALEELLQAGVPLGMKGPRVRTITCCPGAASCHNGLIDTVSLALELDSRFFGKEAGKFKIAVSGCPNSCTKPQENDAGIMGVARPRWIEQNCSDCGLCAKICPTGAIRRSEDGLYRHDPGQCLLCGQCINRCPRDAWEAEFKGFGLFLGGTMGKRPRLGNRVDRIFTSQAELFTCLERALDYFKRHSLGKERFGHMLDRLGAEQVINQILQS